MTNNAPPDAEADVQHQRWALLHEISELVEKPMIVLSVVWLGLFVYEFVYGLSELLQTVTLVIWGIFGLDFLLRFIIAPSKTGYLRRNWLVAISLALPAFRVLRAFRALRILRAARATRSVTLLRLLTTLNRGMNTTRRAFGPRLFGYVVALTIVVAFVGAAGMAYFESPGALEQSGVLEPGEEADGLSSYGESLWWTTTVITTMGPDYSPQTVAGRLVALLLSLYGLAIFGYITASLATFFIVQTPKDAESQETVETEEAAEALRGRIADLQSEMERLRSDLQAFHNQ